MHYDGHALPYARKQQQRNYVSMLGANVKCCVGRGCISIDNSPWDIAKVDNKIKTLSFSLQLLQANLHSGKWTSGGVYQTEKTLVLLLHVGSVVMNESNENAAKMF